ncbi:hypothetical protein AGMMS50255_7150 [Spirochaetia bacterium]|nr:hypothetical protein AGMMS50255_7150 [Spirochaetia bacterium]
MRQSYPADMPAVRRYVPGAIGIPQDKRKGSLTGGSMPDNEEDLLSSEMGKQIMERK